MLRYLKMMLQLILAPTKGWEDVSHTSMSARSALIWGMLPLAALAGASAVVTEMLEARPTTAKIILGVVVNFLQYPLTYFLADAVMTALLPKLTADGRVDRERLGLFLSLSVGMMALIGILVNVLPMEVTLLQFLPLYVLVVMVQGRRYLDVTDDRAGMLAALELGAVIVPIYLLNYLLSNL